MTAQLGEVAMLAQELISADATCAAIEEQLKEAKERARVLREESLPSAMQELGISTFTLTTGEKVSIKQDVYVSIPQDKREEVFVWMEQHGFGGLIKSNVALQFGKGELEAMVRAVDVLRQEGFTPETSREVHAMTLKAFVREQLEKGAPGFPLELFGARPVFKAVLK